jgi:hypothetical protein
MLRIVPVSLFSKKKRLAFALLSGLLAVGIFLVDLQFPRGVAIGLLYITVVLISLKSPHFEDTVYSALLCSFLSVIDYIYSEPAVPASISLTNRILYLGTIWTTAVICILRKQAELERQKLQEQMMEEREKEKRLSMMTPLTNFMSSLLRLGIEAKVAQEGQASNVEKMLENINNAIQHANQLSSQINATGNKTLESDEQKVPQG